MIRGRLAPILVFVTTVLAFGPSLTGDFLTWDDLHKFRDNPAYRGLGWTELRWMWTTTYTGLYQPVAWMTWGADYLLWGTNPVGYHLTSILCHAVTATLVYCLAGRLFERTWGEPAGRAAGPRTAGAALAALVFALHPLRVEPVAWISARGDVLAGLFTVGATLAYLRATRSATDRASRRAWLAASVGLFALGLGAKASAVALPAALVVLDIYPLRRLGGGPGRWCGPSARRVWGEKAPFAAATLAVALLAVLGKQRTGSMLPREPFAPVTAVARGLYGAAFYLRATLLPLDIAPLYERTLRVDPFTWPFVVSGLVVVGITVVLVVGRRRWPAGLAAWVGYLLLLAPSSGLVPYGSQLVAARYSYVPCLGWAILAGAALPAVSRLRSRDGPRGPRWAIAVGVAGTVLLILSVLTWQLARVWRDSETLWTYTLRVAPRSALPHVELGLLAERKGDFALGEAHFRQALEIWPGAHLDDLAMARMFEGEDNHAAAAVHYRRALGTAGQSRALRLALGRALARAGDEPAAVAELQRTLDLFPDFADAHVMLGIVRVAQGQVALGAAEFRAALRLDPASALAHYHLGAALAREGTLAEAAEQYRQALILDPRLAEAQTSLDAVLRQLAAPSRPGTP